MSSTVIARCENCDAALRVSEAAGGTVTCEYCGTESMVGAAPGAAGGAPTVRIEKAPALTADRKQLEGSVTALVIGLCVVVGVLVIFFGGEGSLGILLGGLLFGVFCIWAGIGGHRLYRREVAGVREHQRLRDNGLPGRATVERIVAGDGRRATLGLKVELTGQPERHIEHAATIPELLVPRLVDGLTLPVIVHPNEPDKIEVQWHLV